MKKETYWQRQVRLALDTPNLSPNAVREIEGWGRQNADAEKVRVFGWVDQQATELQELELSIRDELAQGQTSLKEAITAAKTNSISTADFAKAIKQAKRLQEATERRVMELIRGHDSALAMEQDPHGYMEEMIYDRYPPLRNKRPRLVPSFENTGPAEDNFYGPLPFAASGSKPS